MSITSISPAMKMADLLDVNFSILGVFSRFGMSYGFGEATVKEVCDGMGIDPARIAKRRPSLLAIGAINCTLMRTLSPGKTISLSAGKVIVPVTSVVLK